MISIIVPTLNEERRIGRTLECLLSLRGKKEIIVADGGSDDRTVEYACASGVTVMLCECGRGSQMHAAALASRGDDLWFLHPDTVPEANPLAPLRKVLQDPHSVVG